MKPWRWLLLLIAIAALGAIAWNWLAADPGYVLIRMRGWRVEATVVGAVLLLIAAWIAVALAWWLLRWPFGALSRRHRRISRKRLFDGMVALAEGRHAEAGRALERAAQHAPLRAPALLAAAEAAHRRGEPARALETLDEAGQYAPQAARMLRARILRREGRQDEALALLLPEADANRLPPSGWHELVLSALAAGKPQRARAALEPLRRSNALGTRGYTALETRVLAAAVGAAKDVETLHGLWNELSRQQRSAPEVIAAFARRSAQLDSPLAAMEEIEGALRREWSPQLVTLYGELAGDDASARLRTAEGWLVAHPNDAALLVTLGRLALRTQQPQRAREYLRRAVGLQPDTVDGWEVLGEAHSALGEQSEAMRCYANALRATHGETVALSPRDAVRDTGVVAVEERDQHGMPRLPGEPVRPAR
ncbi:MAG TPA: heme biosynthesis HemY N-terminal domain-containing protein [Rhodanobacteraceae bacterium]|nr:heme biosynthesis HemY N-terminal domain-containing protein [Rhodanobacteraceae bacterium]